MPSVSGLLAQLTPRKYNFDTANPYGMSFGHQLQYGFIAQEVEQVFPNLVSSNHKPAVTDTSGNVISQALTYKVLNYNGFFALLTKAIQEQQQKIDSLEQVNQNLTNVWLAIDSLRNRISTTENCLANLPNGLGCTGSSARTSGHGSENGTVQIVELESQTVVLDQNVPNPFSEKTTITYFVPDHVHYAQVIFTDAYGKVMKTVDINHAGQGSLEVIGDKLSSGTYSYSIIVDGVVADTRKMIRIK